MITPRSREFLKLVKTRHRITSVDARLTCSSSFKVWRGDQLQEYPVLSTLMTDDANSEDACSRKCRDVFGAAAV